MSNGFRSHLFGVLILGFCVAFASVGEEVSALTEDVALQEATTLKLRSDFVSPPPADPSKSELVIRSEFKDAYRLIVEDGGPVRGENRNVLTGVVEGIKTVGKGVGTVLGTAKDTIMKLNPLGWRDEKRGGDEFALIEENASGLGNPFDKGDFFSREEAQFLITQRTARDSDPVTSEEEKNRRLRIQILMGEFFPKSQQ